jgi:hypothetical protein
VRNLYYTDNLLTLLLLGKLQAGQIDAVHAQAAFVSCLSVLSLSVSQSSHDFEEVLNCKPVHLPSVLEETSQASQWESQNVNYGTEDAVIEAGVALLIGGKLEEVGPWSVRESDYCEPCPEVSGGTAQAVTSDANVPTMAVACSESERHKAGPRHSFILVPEVFVSPLTRQSSVHVGKLTEVPETPPLPPMRRRASTSIPSLYDSSDDKDDVDFLFGAMPQAPARKSWIEAKFFVA